MENYKCSECGSEIQIIQKIESKTINLPSAKYKVTETGSPHVRYEMLTKELVFFYYDQKAIERTLNNLIMKFVQNNEISSVKIIKAKKNELNELDPHELKTVIDLRLEDFIHWVAEAINANVPVFSVEMDNID